MSLPPVGCKLEKLVDVGNGQLTFSVRRNDDYTAIDAAANTITLLLGAGGEAIRKMEGGGSDLAALGKTGGAILQISKELGGLAGRLQGQTYAGATKEVGAYFAVNGGRLLVAFWPLVESEIKEEFFTVLGRVITRRMAAAAVIGYGTYDLVAELMALGDPSIASYDTAGVQVAGVYPFGATLKLYATSRDTQTYVFDALVSHLPGDFSQPLYLEVDFGDGNRETFQLQNEGGFIPINFTHTYSGTVPKTVRAVLRTGSGKPTIIASQEVDLTSTTTTTTTSTTTSTTAGTDAMGINGTWTGQYKIHLPPPNKDYYDPIEVIFRLSPEGTGTARVNLEGQYSEVDATYRGGVVQFSYGVSLTGQFTGGNILTLTGLFPDGQTQTLTLMRPSPPS